MFTIPRHELHFAYGVKLIPSHPSSFVTHPAHYDALPALPYRVMPFSCTLLNSTKHQYETRESDDCRPHKCKRLSMNAFYFVTL